MMDEQSHYSNHGAVRREVKPNGHRRAFAHDYREVGTYMVTIVTEGRARVFGHIEGSALATKRLERAAWVHDKEAPHIVLSELGRRVLEEEVPKINRFYPQVEVWRVAMMPDHIHLLLRVKVALPEGKHLGQVIRGFKTGCTRAWWALEDEKRLAGGEARVQPSGEALGTMATRVEGDGKEGRKRAAVPEAFPSGYHPTPSGQARRPLLFSSGYHDRIINRPGMLENIKRYMLENPLRARIKEECPRLMQRQLHLWIDGQEYAAFGNLFLLKYPQKEQVFFHRFTEVDERERQAILSSLQESTKTQLHTSKGEGNQPSEGKGIWLKGLYLTDKERQHLEKDPLKMPTHLTAAYSQEHARLLRMAEEGTVLVTPGISKGEGLVVSAALEQQLPLILLQKEPITRYWKPEQRRFYACSRGTLLILSPWQLDEGIVQQQCSAELHLGENTQPVSDYARFHRLNDIARELCGATEMRILNYSALVGA